MAHETIIYGMIDAGDLSEEKEANHHHAANEKVLASLPEAAAFPQLSRGFFSLPVPQAQYRSQVIHFGGSFLSLESRWHEWLAQFEALLKRLHWFGVVLHMESEMLEGDYQYQWLIADDAIETCFFSGALKPVSDWEFTGGPRKFDI